MRKYRKAISNVYACIFLVSGIIGFFVILPENGVLRAVIALLSSWIVGGFMFFLIRAVLK